jgi:hypothetical protein
MTLASEDIRQGRGSRLAPTLLERRRLERLREREEHMMRQLVQIIPAEGWRAVLAGRLRTGGVVLRDKPLACWALVEDRDEDGAWRDVVGLTADGDVEECDLKGGFVGYLREGDDVRKWQAKAERMLTFNDELRELAIPVPAD